MAKKPTIDNGFDRATLRLVADHLAIGLTDLLYDILRLASRMQSGEGKATRPEYLELCDREGLAATASWRANTNRTISILSVRRHSSAQRNSATSHFEASPKIGHGRPTRRRVVQEERAGRGHSPAHNSFREIGTIEQENDDGSGNCN